MYEPITWNNLSPPIQNFITSLGEIGGTYQHNEWGIIIGNQTYQYKTGAIIGKYWIPNDVIEQHLMYIIDVLESFCITTIEKMIEYYMDGKHGVLHLEKMIECVLYSATHLSQSENIIICDKKLGIQFRKHCLLKYHDSQ